MDHFLLFTFCVCHVFLSFIAALLLPAVKKLASWLSCIRSSLVFCHFSMWCPGSGVMLDVSIPDICILTYVLSL